MIALLFALALTTEHLVVISNFLLVAATLLLVWVSMREQHATIKAIVANDNSVIKRAIRALSNKGKADE